MSDRQSMDIARVTIRMKLLLDGKQYLLAAAGDMLHAFRLN